MYVVVVRVSTYIYGLPLGPRPTQGHEYTHNPNSLYPPQPLPHYAPASRSYSGLLTDLCRRAGGGVGGKEGGKEQGRHAASLRLE